MSLHPRATRLLATCLLASLGGGCKRHDMYTQDRASTWDRNSFFHDGATQRPPVSGAVARGEPDPEQPQPARIGMAMLQRGRQRYDIFCAPCHGLTGDGGGMITARGFPRPPPLFSARDEAASAAWIYGVIGHGQGTMYGFADRVPSADRWAMVAYIRALQLGQDAPPEALPAEDRAALAALP